MRLNAMTKCALGVMAYGGTICMSQTASAGLTWLGQFQHGATLRESRNSALEFVPNTFPPIERLLTNGSPALSAETAGLGSFGMVSYSATNAAGFSASLTHNGLSQGQFLSQVIRLFEVTGSESVSWTLSRAGSGYAFYTLFNFDTNQVVRQETTTSGPLTWSTTLTAGTYSLAFEVVTSNGGAAFDGQIVSFVPAPGAFALLGAAGLVGKRRRR